MMTMQSETSWLHAFFDSLDKTNPGFVFFRFFSWRDIKVGGGGGGGQTDRQTETQIETETEMHNYVGSIILR